MSLSLQRLILIIAILKEAESGMLVKDVCRMHGISDAAYYNWKSRYGGINASELKRMRKWKPNWAA